MSQRTAPAAPGSARTSHPIGAIVNSDSHIQYWCQVYGPQEIATPPVPTDYAFGQFVRANLPTSGSGAEPLMLIGVIYDTVLVNPAFGTLGPRLAPNDAQRAVFTPDYLTERATLLRILALGTTNGAATRIVHGVPPLALELGAVVTPIDAAGVRAFHLFADDGPPGQRTPYLHMAYLPQLIAQPNGLLPQAALRILDQLHAIIPEHERLLAVVRRNLAWKLSVEATG